MSKVADEIYSVFTPVVMKPINPKKIVTEVYHRGTFVGGVQECPPAMTLPPPGWQPWK